jgi:signal transduction histidine kinase
MEEAVDISVRDYGLGVQKEHREYIFDRFYQADPQSYRGGFGLGLYISRQIVDLHNGELRASFPQDGGTSFTIHLPGSVIEASTEVSERLVRE